MTFRPYLVILLVLSPLLSAAGIIVVDGTYQGENVYVQNPFNSADNNFCVIQAFVNDEPILDINNSAFEIELSNMEMGTYIQIKLLHKDFCKPRVLNPEVLRSKSTFELVSFKVDDKSVKWTTSNETNTEPFLIEQFKNNKWVPIGKVVGKGPSGYNNYTFDINHHSGLNKYRIKQNDKSGKFRFVQPVEHFSNANPITFYPRRVDKEIYLSETSPYEIYDSFGALVKQGVGESINVDDFDAGIYYLNIDNRTEKFLKK